MMLTNIYKRDKISPVYIRKLLSRPNTYSTQDIKELTIDGTFYFQVTTSIIYVSNHNRTKFQSLVDLGANGVSLVRISLP